MAVKQITPSAEDPMRTGDKVRFCADMLRKQTDLVKQIETRANIVIGLSGASLVFAINNIAKTDHSLAAYVIVCVAIVSTIFALMALKPPRFFSRHGQTSSVFYHTYITTFTQKSFINEVKRVSGDIDLAVEQYAKEAFNIATYSLKYKKKFAHLAITVFNTGLLVTAIFWLFL